MDQSQAVNYRNRALKQVLAATETQELTLKPGDGRRDRKEGVAG